MNEMSSMKYDLGNILRTSPHDVPAKLSMVPNDPSLVNSTETLVTTTETLTS